MPINVTGSTDTSGAISVMPTRTKVVCVVGVKGGTPTTTALTVADIVSTAEASTLFGSTAKAVNMVEILIKNGVSQIKGILVPETGSDYATVKDAYDAAFDKLLLHDVDIIVIDTSNSTVITALKDHLTLAESEDKFRYGCVGKNGTNAELTALATSINDSRIVLAGPDLYDKNMGDADETLIGAGIASIIAVTTDPAQPNDGVELLGFGGCKRTVLKSEKEALANAGVTVLYQSAGGRPMTYQVVTTYTKNTQGAADPVWHDLTTRLIADHVLSTNQQLIKANFQRTKNVDRILSAIRTMILVNMQTQQSLEIIENFDPATLTVLKDPTDQFGALVNYVFDVVTPLYNVTITQSLKL